MADARQRVEWGRTASLAAMVNELLRSGRNPFDLIPDRYRPDAATPEPVGDDDGELGFALLAGGLKAWADQNK